MKQALIDTNIISYFFRSHPVVIQNLQAYQQYYSYLSFSIFTYYEITSGLAYKDAKQQSNRFKQLSYASEIVPFDTPIAQTASQIYATLRQRGLAISSVDLFIGATALYCNYILITANIKHFQYIDGLTCADWSKE